MLRSDAFRFLVRKLQRNVEDYGWHVTARKCLTYLLGLFYFHQVYRIYRISLETPATELGSNGQEFTFKLLAPDDTYAIGQVENLAEWLRHSLRKRLGRGDLCLVALKDEKVAGFNLVTFGDVFMPLIKLNRTFRARDAWSEHITVLKEFRQKGLASQLRYRIFAELRKRGLSRLYGGTLRSNLASLKLARKVGFREIVDVKHTRVLGFKNWRYERIKN